MLRATCRSMLALALLSWCGCKHTCDDTPSDVVEFFEPIEQTQTRSLAWVGLVETGELDESQAWTSVTVEVLLANDSATAADANPAIGCDAHFTIDATMLITSDDGLLDESIPIEL
ncbi:MAG TPA: hypothetical protein VM869_11905, partial [Enhygromyxa sp.]|nr:hypothetical protein [Enhygromyxa sp.]